MIFTWQKPQWERFVHLKIRLPHAILIFGPKGVGKFEFARTAAALLLCQRVAARPDSGEACGVCTACKLFALGNHPDFFAIQPETDVPDSADADVDQPVVPAADKKKKPSKQIKIAQIREVLESIQTGAHQGGRRLILIAPAEAMNAATANALLKTLEEPPPDTILLLVSSEPARLLPTIRSRCQSLAFAEPDRQLALAWLRQQDTGEAAELLARYGGAPLLALDAAGEERGMNFRTLIEHLAGPEDPLACAEILAGADPLAAVDCIQRWVSDLVTFGLAGRIRYFPGFEAAVSGVAGSAPMLSLLRLSRRLTELRAIANHPVNPRLFAERLATDYAEAIRPSGESS